MDKNWVVFRNKYWKIGRFQVIRFNDFIKRFSK